MINEMKQIITVISILLMVCLPVAASVNNEVEIRGSVATGDIVYSSNNFAGFWYDLDTNQTSETMNITVVNRTIAEGDLIYTCEAQIVEYENPVLGNYSIIGFLAEKYIGYNDRVDKLVKLLIEWKGSDSKMLGMNEDMMFSEGYSLEVREIDLTGDKTYLTLLKDGIEIDSEIITAGNLYNYFDSDDVLVFSCTVDSVFRGTDSNLVVIKYIFLRSENIIDVDTGDSFGVMKVKSVSGNTIILKNDDPLTLDSDSKVDIMTDLYFKTSDNDTLRYYLAKNIYFSCPPCPECPEIEPCPECNESEPEVIIEYINVTEYINTTEYIPADKPKNTPGFEAVFAIAGLFIVAWIVLKQRK